MTMRSARHNAGFTLVELLVALAIFMVIMGSLAMLLSGAVNTTSQGYAMMNAMERARGAMAVLEADLKTAFSSPEKRQFFQFYGEPNGFMYSGQLSSGGFGRVTYAVHTDNATPPMQGLGGYETVTLMLAWSSVAEQFARVLCPVPPPPTQTLTVANIDKNGDGVHDITMAGVDASVDPAFLLAWNAAKPGNGFDLYAERLFNTQIMPGSMPPNPDDQMEFTLRIQRGVLLRYEERGQGTLSQFSDPTMRNLFAFDGNSSLVSPFGSAADDTSLLARFPAATAEKLDRLQQNHYWVRRLTGNLPLNGVVDPFTASMPMNFWKEDGNSDGKSWRDYVVTEGILVSAELVLPDTDQPVMGFDSALLNDSGAPGGRTVAINALDLSSFFSFGIENGSVSKQFNTLWNMASVELPSLAGLPPPVSISRPMFNYFLYGTPVNPVQNNAAAFAEALRVQVYDYAPGDPMKPRLPAWVAPGFWIFGDPPRSGAPPFHQWFQQKADIPSAFLRENSGT